MMENIAKKRDVLIPVVYAVSEDYCFTLITLVSIVSLLESKNDSTYYKIYILHEEGYQHKEMVKSTLIKYDGFQVVFKGVGDYFKNAKSPVEEIKKATFFRLMISELIEEDKAMYLDSDTIICKDLACVFSLDMGDAWVGGVKAPLIIKASKEERDRLCDEYNIPNVDQYINAGVLMWNNIKLREFGVCNRFLKRVPVEENGADDQNIINSECYGNILFLPFSANVMTKYYNWETEDYLECFSEEEIIMGWNDPVIIHYADIIKPWNEPTCPLSDKWWITCEKSPFFDFFFERIREVFFQKTVYRQVGSENDFTTLSIPFFFRYRQYKLCVYGAGKRAIDFISYAREIGSEICRIYVTSMNNNPKSIYGVPVVVFDEKEKKDDHRDEIVVVATMEKVQICIMREIRSCNFKRIIPLRDSWKPEVMNEV